MEKNIQLNINEEFSMELKSHGTSGYQWFIDLYDKDILEVSIESADTKIDIDSVPAGASTNLILNIKGIKSGTSNVSLSERRVWEVGIAPINTIELKVTVI